MNDVNERVRQEWKASTTARGRIKEVLEETTEYATAAEIATRALTSEPTTRKYLAELVDEGVGVSRQEGRAAEYKRNEGRLVDRRIAELRSEHTRDELVDGIREMKGTIRDFRERYDVESPEELATALDPEEDGWADVGRWQATRRNLAFAQAALHVDEAHRLVEA